MRQIKFRGKSIETGQWVYGSLLQMQSGSSILVEDIDAKLYDEYKVIPDTVGQFTGLYDKDGREIYEGDILSSGYMDAGNIEVRFVRGVFAFLWNGDLDNECPTTAPTHEWAEVIGNIHDNPELLKMK